MSSCRTLPPGVVDGVFPIQDHLGNGHKSVTLLNEGSQDGRQGLRRVLGRIMEQNDGAGLDLCCDPLGDLLGGDLLPVQAVAVLNARFKKGRHLTLKFEV